MTDLVIFFAALVFFMLVYWLTTGDLVETVVITVVLLVALYAVGYTLQLGGVI